MNDSLTERIEFRAFPGMAKDIRRAYRDFPDRFSSESHVIRVALMQLFRQLDADRLKKNRRRK